MIGSIVAWFRSRTPREQVLLQVAAFVVVIGGGLTWGYQAASAYRAEAASDLASAQQLRDDVARLSAQASDPAAVVPAASDGTARGAASAIATQFGLSLSLIEPDGPTGVRVTFSPAAARAIYGWVDAVERSGLAVTRISLVRVGEGDLVQADATLSARKT
ncbi:MAG: type II secretion system protein GspM [Hyphomonadaceae bacterium]